jgi:thioredoxin 1
MKAGDIIMWAFAGLFAFMLWAAFGPVGKASSSGPSGGPAAYRAALASGQPVLLEFSADWCGPCQQVKPLVHELAAEVAGKAKVVPIDVDQQPDLAQQYGVSGIPCFVVLRNGKESGRQVGAIPKSEMKRLLGL